YGPDYLWASSTFTTFCKNLTAFLQFYTAFFTLNMPFLLTINLYQGRLGREYSTPHPGLRDWKSITGFFRDIERCMA
ncbi:MAG TPA: hypothetical protein VJS64_06005, partial [Pyrinomonadaceae bacterium]|nr:hypothetical protein [Pyrinomonadaceae bacterium]